MAINLASGTGGRRSRGLPAMAEINVTPFVDVVLVLLIIFIITAHVMDYGIDIDVPKTRTVATSVKDLPIVNVSKSGEVTLGSAPVDHLANLGQEIRAKYPGQNAVYLRASGEAQFDPVAQVMSQLGADKFAVSVVTEPYDAGSRRR